MSIYRLERMNRWEREGYRQCYICNGLYKTEKKSGLVCPECMEKDDDEEGEK